ncbi:hypothetical protein ACFLXI_06130 [Chloroflexota bacterium]
MTESQEIPAPPRLIPALVGGFDAITNHIFVILFPIIFDILIWFAPHLRLKSMIENFIGEMVLLSSNEGTELSDMIDIGKDTWLQIADQINLAVALRSYPVGVPSLMVSSLPLETPLGIPFMLEVSSFRYAVFIVIILIGLGLLSGTLFYQLVAQVALTGEIMWMKIFYEWPKTSIQVILLALIWMALFIVVSIPASCLISIAALAGFSMGQLSILLYGGFLIWLIFPLLFSAHGIFIKNLAVWPSIRLSIRITNATLLTTVLFFLSVFILVQGLDILWRIPPADSWLSLLGIVGHAFVVTGLLSASFVYYRDADRWVMSVHNHLPNNEKSII